MPLGNFEIQLITLAPSMDWDSLLGDMAAGTFSLQAAGAETQRYRDGAGTEIRLIGTFGEFGGAVSSLVVFEDGVRSARMDFEFPVSLSNVGALLPELEGRIRAEGGLVLKGGTAGDLLTGGDRDDRLDGRGGRDGLHGGDGEDVLLGREGRDALTGGRGNDTLNGGTGTDLLIGGAGTNRLDGGADTDLFVFDTDLGAAHTDVILPSFAEIVFTFDDIIALEFAEIVFTLTGTSDTILLSDLDSDAASLAEVDAAVLADLGLKLRETPAGNAILDFGGGERMVVAGLGLDEIDPDRIVLTDRPLGEAVADINTLFGTQIWYDEPIE